MARGTTMPAQAPSPCRKRKAISHSMVGASAAADAADREQREADIERRLAADHVGDRPEDDLAEAEGRGRTISRLICTAAVLGVQVRADRRQRRQVHVDGEGADGGQQAEHDRDAEKSGSHDWHLSISVRPRAHLGLAAGPRTFRQPDRPTPPRSEFLRRSHQFI